MSTAPQPLADGVDPRRSYQLKKSLMGLCQRCGKNQTAQSTRKPGSFRVHCDPCAARQYAARLQRPRAPKPVAVKPLTKPQPHPDANTAVCVSADDAKFWPDTSWWVGLTRDELTAACAKHFERMRQSKFGRLDRFGYGDLVQGAADETRFRTKVGVEFDAKS